MTKKILVNYTGGYCGNFLCSLLSDSLNTKDVMGEDKSNNSYEFLSSGVHTMFIKPFGKIFQIHNKTIRREDLEKIKQYKLDNFYTYVNRLYDFLWDEDEEVFIDNIKNYYNDLMSDLTGDYFITSIHYAFQYKNLSIHDVFKDTTVLHLYTTDKRYGRYFTLLLYYKTRNAKADQILQSTTLSSGGIYYDIIDPVLPVIKDPRSIPVDIGRITFGRDFDHLSEVEDRLSHEIGSKLTLDRQRLSDYADRNEAIIKEILGDDFKTQTDREQVKKSIEFIEYRLRV